MCTGGRRLLLLHVHRSGWSFQGVSSLTVFPASSQFSLLFLLFLSVSCCSGFSFLSLKLFFSFLNLPSQGLVFGFSLNLMTHFICLLLPVKPFWNLVFSFFSCFSNILRLFHFSPAVSSTSFFFVHCTLGGLDPEINYMLYLLCLVWIYFIL